MTPQERQQLQELIEWKRQKELQQLSNPLDDSSRAILKTFTKTGIASSTTQSISLSGESQSIDVPAQPDGVLSGVIDGQQVSIPYYN